MKKFSEMVALMRIATYNVEWFDALFDDDGGLLNDDRWSRRYDVKRSDQLAALGIVFTALNADAVMMVSKPRIPTNTGPLQVALENFAKHYRYPRTQGVGGV